MGVVRAAVLLTLAAAACGGVASRADRQAVTHDEITVQSGGVRLAARVSSPGGRGPYPAVVSVHGSGRVGREQYRGDWERLVPHGVVVLTYDKRGVGESTGEFVAVGTSTSDAYMPLLAADALACLRALRGHPGVDPARVGFLGTSQAGWLIPLALAQAAPGEAAFAVIRSGPATSVGLEMAYSRLTGDGVRAPASPGLTPEEMDRRLAEYPGPHGIDTVPLLGRLRTPTLWLLGGRDESIPIRQTQQNLAAAVAAGAPITVRTYPEADHSLMQGGRPVPYWEDLVRWLRAQAILP